MKQNKGVLFVLPANKNYFNNIVIRMVMAYGYKNRSKEQNRNYRIRHP